MEHAHPSSIRLAVAAGALLVAACSSSSTPSTFGSGGGSEGGVMDAAASESGSFTEGGGGGSGNFMCGASMCTRYDWCLFIVSATGAEMSATCVPYGTCQACNCLEQMVSAGQCAGDSVSCTPQPPLTVSCVPGGGSPGDSGSPD